MITRSSLLLPIGLMLIGQPAFADRLPVFTVAAPTIDNARAAALLPRAQAPTLAPKAGVVAPGITRPGVTAPGVVAPPPTIAPTFQQDATRVTHRLGTSVVEIDKRGGSIFVGNMAQLWNPTVKPSALPEPEQARAIAERYLKDNGLMPVDRSVQFVFSHFSETAMGNDVPGQLDKTILDRQVNYKAVVRTRTADGKDVAIPVTGGGAKLKVSVGDRGAVVGFFGGWRTTTGIAGEEEIKPLEAAIEEAQRRMLKTRIVNPRAELAYYAAPGFQQQSYLAPVWVVSGQLQNEKELVPMRVQIVAATKYGPFIKSELAPPRDLNFKPAPPDEDERPEAPRTGLLDLPRRALDFLVPPANAAVSTFECGTSWIGTSQGLPGSQGNKQGFVDQCRAAGWQVSFDWGDLAAWESDFRANDDQYVDNVDVVFYTGHANQNGWTLNKPSDTSLNFGEVAGGQDLYGVTDLEWLIVAACGPLQSSHFVTNTTNAFDRWRSIFDGLHVFLGYGAVTFDNTDEGRRFMELSRAGWNVIDAWFRTALEVQASTNSEVAPDGPTIWVTAMYAHDGGDHCARNDHLWGMGSVCNDATGSNQWRTLMWSGT